MGPLLFAVGCTNDNVDRTLTARSRTIGLAYALPDQVDFAYRGITVFNNNSTKGDATAWKLDSAFLTAVRPFLDGKYAVLTAKVPSTVYDESNNGFKLVVTEPSGDDIRKAFGATLPHADLWVVLRPTCMEGGGGGPFPCGVGLYWWHSLMFAPSPVAGIWGEMVVYDGSSFDVVAARPLAISAPICPVGPDNDPDPIARGIAQAFNSGEPKSCLPAQTLDDTWRIDNWNETTSNQREDLHRLYKNLLTKSVAPTMRTLKLID